MCHIRIIHQFFKVQPKKKTKKEKTKKRIGNKKIFFFFIFLFIFEFHPPISLFYFMFSPAELMVLKILNPSAAVLIINPLISLSQ